MKILNKALVGTAAATAMAVSASPAMAKDHKNGIGAGEVIAGAVVLGGLAAILTSGKKDSQTYDYRGGNDRYGEARGGRIGSRKAVNRCVRTAERRATRNWGWADVTQIRDVDRTRNGWRVKGRIVVKDHQKRGGKGRYHNSNYRQNYDRGKFTCFIESGDRPQIKFRNLDRGNRY